MTITTSPTEVHAGAGGDDTVVRPYTAPTGVLAWLTTGDHKRIGRLYVGFAFLMGLGAAGVGALLSLERVDETSRVLLYRNAVGQLFSLYRFGFALLVVLPLLLGLAIAIVPLQVGAPGIAFPRAAALSLWTWLVGAGLMIGAYAGNGGPGGGDSQGVALFLTALAMVLVALVTAAVCIATTVLSGRAAGMALERVPALAWAGLTTSAALVVSLPVVLGNVILLTVDHRYGRDLFGGNLEIGKYLDAAVRQPQTYLYAVIGLGVVADVVATLARARQQMRGVLFTGIGLAAVLGVGVDIQQALNPDVHHQFLFLAASIAFVFPVLVVLAWSALALKEAKGLRATASLALAVLSLLLLLAAAVLGALTGFERLGLVGTTYELGHFNLVLGSALLAGLAGVFHWWPKLTGRLVSDALAKLLVLPALGGVVLIAALELVLGFDDVAADTVKETGSDLAQAAGVVGFVGQLLVLVTIVGAAGLLVRAWRNGEPAGDDPWDGQTLEWATPSPAPAANFAEGAVVTSAEPLFDLKHAAGKDA